MLCHLSFPNFQLYNGCTIPESQRFPPIFIRVLSFSWQSPLRSVIFLRKKCGLRPFSRSVTVRQMPRRNTMFLFYFLACSFRTLFISTPYNHLFTRLQIPLHLNLHFYPEKPSVSAFICLPCLRMILYPAGIFTIKTVFVCHFLMRITFHFSKSLF